MKKGQKFEDNFRKSIDRDNPELFYYRFKDGTANWDRSNQNVRFQAHNIADHFIFYRNRLFICELKSHKGKSLPFSCIRDTQYAEMFEASKKKNVLCLVFVFFSDIEECYVTSIQRIIEFRVNSDRKSIPLSFFQEHGFKIDCRKLKTNYRFDVQSFLDLFK